MRDYCLFHNTELAVFDVENSLVFGKPLPIMRDVAEIRFQGIYTGRVEAVQYAEAAASIVTFILQKEEEIRGLSIETLEQYREIKLLGEIGELMSSVTELEDVAHTVLEKVHRLIPGDNGSLMLYDEESGHFNILGAFGGHSSVKANLAGKTGIVGAVFNSRKGEIVNDVRSDSRYVPGGLAVSSLICVPLVVKEKGLGVLNISSEKPVTYTSQHLNMLQTLASEVAVTVENARLYTDLRETFYSTVYTLAETIERRDAYTGGHTRRVMEYSLGIGKTLHLDKDLMSNLKLVSMLHDIGKIGVSDFILQKPGKLSPGEFEMMKSHAAAGGEILYNIKAFRPLVPGIRHHHERHDGTGYPDGLAGGDIPVLSRIVSVADTFDAMTSDRPYRKGLTPAIAFQELIRCSGTQFDPIMAAAFIEHFSSSFGFDPGSSEEGNILHNLA